MATFDSPASLFSSLGYTINKYQGVLWELKSGQDVPVDATTINSVVERGEGYTPEIKQQPRWTLM